MEVDRDDMWFEAFGYSAETHRRQVAAAFSAGCALIAETLQSVVALDVEDADGNRYHLAMHPDQADLLAEELQEAARLARSKSLTSDTPGPSPDR